MHGLELLFTLAPYCIKIEVNVFRLDRCQVFCKSYKCFKSFALNIKSSAALISIYMLCISLFILKMMQCFVRRSWKNPFYGN